MKTTITIIIVVLVITAVIVLLQNFFGKERHKKIVAVYYYKLKKNQTFKGMFETLVSRFSRNLDNFCFADSRSGVEKILQEKKNWFCKKDLNTLVLFKEKNKFFVLCTGLNSDGSLKEFIFEFEDNSTWYANHNFCIAVPEFSKGFIINFLKELVKIKRVVVSPLIMS